MSLINRDALLSYADLWASCGEHYTAEDVIMMIKTAPTVDAADVAPVRHGSWGNYEPYSDGYRCSYCKLVHRTCTTYCPNCGTLMDLK